ncbi:MAG: sulfatase-like hydrolase/transferase [Caldilineaceae bacterium]
MPTKPDVLLILTDQWNPRMMGCAGDPVVRTPHLDALAAEGVLFRRAYTQSPVCMPARCSLASGRYPHNHGFWMNFTGRKFPAEEITLFRDIQRAGYTTAKIGKFHYYNLEWGEDYRDHQAYYDALGLDWAQELPTPYMGPYLRNGYTAHLQTRGLLDAYLADIAERFAIGDFDVVRPSPLPPDDHQDGYITHQALAYLERCPTDKPLFLCVSLPGPHTPFDAPGHYAELFDPAAMVLAPNVPAVVRQKFDRDHIRRAQANYYGKLAHLDDRVGQLVAALKQRGTWENTLLIFAADHGEYLGSHGKLAKGGFEEESARIPLLMHWPGHLRAGHQSDALAQWIDIYPTIIDAIGGVMSPGRFGQSLLPVATGATDAVHDAVFSEIGRGDQLNYMVRTAQYKWFVQNGQAHLFDLDADPYEVHNLIASPAHSAVVQAMQQRLLDFLMQTQVNHAAGYQNLFTRIGLIGEAQEGMAERLLTMFQQVHNDA